MIGVVVKFSASVWTKMTKKRKVKQKHWSTLLVNQHTKFGVSNRSRQMFFCYCKMMLSLTEEKQNLICSVLIWNQLTSISFLRLLLCVVRNELLLVAHVHQIQQTHSRGIKTKNTRQNLKRVSRTSREKTPQFGAFFFEELIIANVDVEFH